MKHKIIKLSSLIIVPLLFIAEAQATIYKCVNAKAEVYYNDKPCPVSEIERQLKSVNDPEGGYIPPAFVSDKEKTASKSAVVGSTSERTINKTEKETSDNSNTARSNGSSSSNTQSSTKGSQTASKTNSQSNSQTNSNLDSAIKNGSVNYPVKNVIRKEGDYKKEG